MLYAMILILNLTVPYHYLLYRAKKLLIARQIIPVYIVSRGACIEQEKWELQAVNADLQQRLQQTVALAHMQVASPSSCDAELGYLVRYCTMYSVYTW